MDLAAVERVAAGQTGLQDQVGTISGDQVLDADVVVVDGRVEVGQKPRRQHQPDRIGVGLLRCQTRAAADQTVVLGCRIPGDGAVLCRGHPSQRALCGRGSGQAGSGAIGARILGSIQLHSRLQEQLLDVRRPNGSLVHAAEPQIVDRRPLQAGLVGVGRAEGQVIVGIAIPGFEDQRLGERLVREDRQASLHEELRDVQ